MGSLTQRVRESQKFSKVFEWAKLISITGMTQIIVQVLGFGCGILVLRLLPTNEYAFYTIANTMLGTMTILADGGIAAGVMAQGGKVWKDRQKLGVVLATGIDLRRKFAIGSLIVAVPIMLYLLIHHDASWIMAVLIVLSLIPAFFMALSGTLHEIAPKLQQDINPLQKVQIGINVGRLAILGMTIFVFPWAFVAVLGSGIPQIWANWKLRSVSKGYADWSQSPDPEVQKEILTIVKRILPSSIYFCISGQLTIWIISLFGSTSSLSEIGGLGRLSMIFTVFTVMFSILLGPRFARMPFDRKSVVQRFVQLQFVTLILALVLALSFYLFSDVLLWVLGPRFSGLNKEVLFVAFSGGIGLLNAITNQLLNARGLIVPPQIFIPIAVAVQVGFVFVLKLDTVIGVLQYGIYTTIIMYLIRMIYFFVAIRKNEAYT
jgi:O-antigen/teichoic acid export membrane protein